MNKKLKQLNEVVALFGDETSIQLEEGTYLKNQDMLALLQTRGYIMLKDVSTLSGTAYLVVKQYDFADFKKWLKEQIKDSKKMKRRDWTIAIISGIIGAAVGAVIGLIPWIVGQVQ